jgi:hypothetical protein
VCARRRCLAAVVVGLGSLLLALPASAAFPGRNGKIAFTRFDSDGEIYAMNRDGSHKRRSWLITARRRG